MALVQNDFQTDTWARLRSDLRQKFDAARDLLERTDDPTTAAKIRGRIAAYRELLALETAPAPVRQPGFDPAAGEDGPSY